MSENYWVIETLPANNTSEIVVFLNDQINKLKEMTSGNVIAVFEPRRISELEKMTKQIARKMDTELPRASIAEDASNLYKKREYEYYITDNKRQYELAIFTLSLNEEYPAIISIDNEIAKEIAMKQETQTIYTIDDFLEIYKKIIQSHKVTYVIRKLNEMS